MNTYRSLWLVLSILGIFSALTSFGEIAVPSGRCEWKKAPTVYFGMPDLNTSYYWFNTKVTADTAFIIEGERLPVGPYFSVAAYINGVPIGNISDFKIQVQSGTNPFPPPGNLSRTPQGVASSYKIFIGTQNTGAENYIPIPSNAIGKQIAIALRYYAPIVNMSMPKLRSVSAASGVPKGCPKYETWFIDPDLLSGYNFPVLGEADGTEVPFVRVGGDGLYPDKDGYLGAASISGVTLFATPRPPYPQCVGFGCLLDRRDRPAYTSLVVGNSATVTLSSISDREMTADEEGIVYLAAISNASRSNLSVARALRDNGFVTMDAAVGGNFFAYRQKLVAEDYVNALNKVPAFPSPAPADPQTYFAAAHIEAAPVAIHCNAQVTSLLKCVASGKARLKALRDRYAAERAMK